MNQTISNGSLVCTFTSSRDFLHAANNQSAFITRTVTNCPEVCNVFYGTGNPDITGIGVTIAFALQLVIVGLSGVLLMTIRWIAFEKWTDLPRSQSLRRLHRQTVELSDSVTLVNIFISIAIGAASISMVRAGPPPIFEDEILRLINGIQFWLLALYLLIGFCLIPFRPKTKLRFCILATCGGFTCYLMYLDFFLSRRVSGHDVPAYKLVVQICEETFQYPKVWVNYDSTQQEDDEQRKSENDPKNYAYLAAIPASILAIGVFVGIMVLTEFFMDWLDRRCKPLHRFISSVWNFIVTSPSRAYKLFHKHRLLRAFLVVSIFYGHYVAGVSYAVFRLYKYRYRIKQFNQEEFQSNQWSFGQITAIVAYVPVGYDILISIAALHGNWLRDEEQPVRQHNVNRSVDVESQLQDLASPDSSPGQPVELPSLGGSRRAQRSPHLADDPDVYTWCL